MSEVEISIEYNKQQTKEKVPSDYKKFLERIKALYKFTDSEMNTLTLSYKDPDEDDFSSFIIIESPDEFQEFLSERYCSYLVINIQSISLPNIEEDKPQTKEKKRIETSLPLPQPENPVIKEEDNTLMLKLEQMMQVIINDTKDSLKDIQVSLNNMNKDTQLIKNQLTKVEKDIETQAQSFQVSQSEMKKEIMDQLQEKEESLTNAFHQAITKLRINNRKKNKIIHSDIHCFNCQVKPIKGFRYKCTQCEEENLCETCYEQSIHNEHCFIVIQDPEKYKEQAKPKEKSIQPIPIVKQTIVVNHSFKKLLPQLVGQVEALGKERNNSFQLLLPSFIMHNEIVKTGVKINECVNVNDNDSDCINNNEVDENNFGLIIEKDNNHKLNNSKMLKKKMIYQGIPETTQPNQIENVNQLENNCPPCKVQEIIKEDEKPIKTVTKPEEKKEPSYNQRDKEFKQMNSFPEQSDNSKLFKDQKLNGKENGNKPGTFKEFVQQNSREYESTTIVIPRIKKDWEKEYQEMDKRYDVGQRTNKNLVIEIIEKHNGNIDAAFEALLFHDSLIN